MKPRWNDQTIVHDILRRNFEVFSEGRAIGYDERKVWLDHILTGFENSQIIIADNVVDLMYESMRHGEFRRHEDLPYCIPPFIDSIVTFKTHVDSVEPLAVQSVAIHNHMAKNENGVDIDIFREKYLNQIDTDDEKLLNSKHMFIQHLWIKLFNGNTYLIDGWNAVLLDENGKVTFLAANYSSKNQLPSVQMYLGITLEVFAFMNCKNVQNLPCDSEFTPKYGKKFKGERIPSLKWNRIRVTGLPSGHKHNDSHTDENLKGKSLHICRGHFSTYKEDGKGLFGRGIYGTFWVPQHIRGDKGFGTVIKDYEVG